MTPVERGSLERNASNIPCAPSNCIKLARCRKTARLLEGPKRRSMASQSWSRVFMAVAEAVQW